MNLKQKFTHETKEESTAELPVHKGFQEINVSV